MDPVKDQPTTDTVGVIRWASGEEPASQSPDSPSPLSPTAATSTTIIEQTTPTTSSQHQHLRNKVTYYEKVWSSGKKPPAPAATAGVDETDRGIFAIDVNAFERRLQEERERKSHEHSPRIEVKLRTTPQPSPRPTDLPLSSNIRVNIRHQIDADNDTPVDDVQPRRIQHHSHVVTTTYEKIVSTKSRNVSRTSVTSPVTHTVEYNTRLYDSKSPSTERIAGADDSAYHSHRTRHASGSTPTPTSSNTSLHGNFPSDENVFARQVPHVTSSRERIFVRAGSEPPHSWSSGSETTSSGNIVGVAKTATATSSMASPVSSVAPGNNEFVRRHLVRERCDSGGGGDSDGVISHDWYTDYTAHTLHTATPPRMDFKRSNSQYDNHIRQIRGIFQIISSFRFVHSAGSWNFFFEKKGSQSEKYVDRPTVKGIAASRKS